MKKLAFLVIATVAITSCTNNSTSSKDDLAKIQEETIKIHDEIMPQISDFDKSTIKIDSFLVNLSAIKASKPVLDTTNSRQELTKLKTDLENATDHMMSWMKDYNADSMTLEYANSELVKVKEMKKIFEQVTKENQEILKKY